MNDITFCSSRWKHKEGRFADSTKFEISVSTANPECLQQLIWLHYNYTTLYLTTLHYTTTLNTPLDRYRKSELVHDMQWAVTSLNGQLPIDINFTNQHLELWQCQEVPTEKKISQNLINLTQYLVQMKYTSSALVPFLIVMFKK